MPILLSPAGWLLSKPAGDAYTPRSGCFGLDHTKTQPLCHSCIGVDRWQAVPHRGSGWSFEQIRTIGRNTIPKRLRVRNIVPEAFSFAGMALRNVAIPSLPSTIRQIHLRLFTLQPVFHRASATHRSLVEPRTQPLESPPRYWCKERFRKTL
jgi:hypothetical protein